MHVQGQEAYGKSLYFPLNFAVNLNCFKKKSLKRMSIGWVSNTDGWIPILINPPIFCITSNTLLNLTSCLFSFKMGIILLTLKSFPDKIKIYIECWVKSKLHFFL